MTSTNAPETMIAVFHTHGGRRYHATRSCYALRRGQDLWDTDDWSGYAVREETAQQAANRGKTPCTACKPVVVEVPLFGQTFGHEPVPTGHLGPSGRPTAVCARCTERGVLIQIGGDDPSPLRIAWPCRSALALGLVDRERVSA